MNLSKQNQIDNITKETNKFWDLSSQIESNEITGCMVGFTQTIESGELSNYMNDTLYNDVFGALKNVNYGITSRNQNLIFLSLQVLVKAISHFPSIKAMLG